MKRTALLLAAISSALAASPALAKDTQYVLHVDGMTCPFCVATSKKALKEMAGVKAVSTDLDRGTITLCADNEKARLDDKALAEMFRKRGFTYRGKRSAGACPA